MSKTVTIPEETYERLEREAKARGVSMSQTITELAQERESMRIQGLLERLRGQGLVASLHVDHASSASEAPPIPIHGKPLSETIIEERR